MDDQYLSCVPMRIRVEKMRVIKNLIEVKIRDVELDRANFKDGITIEVQGERPFTVNAYWIVNILQMHAEIEQPWITIKKSIAQRTFLSGPNQSMYQSEPQIISQIHKIVECVIKPPQPIDTSSLTTTPRDFYPLAIIVNCNDGDTDVPLESAAASILIVHIRDSVVNVNSHIIKQYIKQIGGRILDISRLYAEEASACCICFEEADPDGNLKLFCLLPCRHSSVCSECLRRIRECPKCRCPIASVFDINAPESNSQPTPPAPPIDPSLSHLYDSADDQNDTGRARPRFWLAQIKSFLRL